MMEPERLDKRVATLLSCSRSVADQYIVSGWVLVDGEIIEQPQFKITTQTVTLHADAKLAEIEPATFLLHKPAGVIAVGEGADPAARHLLEPAARAAEDSSGIRALQGHRLRLQVPMPLQTDASGLLVMSQDWRVVRRLAEDAERLEEEMIVEVSGELVPYGLALLNHGLSFDGRRIAPMKVSWQNETRLRFAIKGRQPGQLESMCKDVGLSVLGMKRIRIGRISMGKLAAGQWRYLRSDERF
ncbi:MAG: rRNA pseudouridine synthase [Dokdonella sp.]